MKYEVDRLYVSDLLIITHNDSPDQLCNSVGSAREALFRRLMDQHPKPSCMESPYATIVPANIERLFNTYLTASSILLCKA